MGKMTQLHDKDKKVILRKDGSTQVIKDNGSETKTDQSFKEIQNVNTIVRKYTMLGYKYENLPEAAKGVYGDFSKVKDYQSALQQSIKVQESFMKLPADLRKRFYNDPQKLAEFLKDSKNKDEAIRLGIIEKPVEPVIITKTETEPKK